jgi:transcription elongation factor GreA
MTVKARFIEDDEDDEEEEEEEEEEVTFLLALREESGTSLGVAIVGKKVGERATYSLPNGRTSTVEMMKAVPYTRA